jgi:hypothetical protein
MENKVSHPLDMLGVDPYKYVSASGVPLTQRHVLLEEYGRMPRNGSEQQKILIRSLTDADDKRATMETTRRLRKEYEVILEQNANMALESVADFYVMNYLWFWCGAGQAAYGYSATGESVKIPGGIVTKIQQEFTATTYKLGYSMADAMDRAIRRELTHVIHPQHPNYTKYGRSYALDTTTYAEWIEVVGKHNEKDFNPYTIDRRELPKILGNPRWYESYAGKPWIDANNALSSLVKTLDFGPDKLKDLVVQLDSILDMQHNTGNLLSHTEFTGVTKAFLDRRAACKNVGALVPLCSGPVGKLAKSVNRYFGLEIPKDSVNKTDLIKVTFSGEGQSSSAAALDDESEVPATRSVVSADEVKGTVQELVTLLQRVNDTGAFTNSKVGNIPKGLESADPKIIEPNTVAAHFHFRYIPGVQETKSTNQTIVDIREFMKKGGALLSQDTDFTKDRALMLDQIRSETPGYAMP